MTLLRIPGPARSARLAALLLSTTLAACASVVGGAPRDTGPSFRDVAGSWSGTIEVDGQALAATVEVEQNGPDLAVTVRIPDIELVSRGEGSVLPDGTTRFGFEYNVQCPGRSELVGEISSDGTTLGGTLVATDCTGDLRGTFSFSR
jgi:hypothetical protein